MKNIKPDIWLQANQNYLSARLAELRGLLEQYIARMNGATETENPSESARQQVRTAAQDLPSASALETLSAVFGLSSFEEHLLLLCAGVELDTKMATLCAIMNGEPLKKNPNFSLALQIFPDLDWRGLTPESPLRFWRLVEVGAGPIFTQCPLRIDERILHFLTGMQPLDERLIDHIRPLALSDDLVPSHQAFAKHIVQLWHSSTSMVPVVQLCGSDVLGQQQIAAAACSEMQMTPGIISALAIPENLHDLEIFIRFWEREVVLCGRALLIDCHPIENEIAHRPTIKHFIEHTSGVIILLARSRIGVFQRPIVTFEVPPPEYTEQLLIWQTALEQVRINPDGKLNQLVTQFSLNPRLIRTICAEVAGKTDASHNQKKNSNPFWESVWDTCRRQTRPRLEGLARRIESAATWEDLVLPSQQKQTLKEIAVHVRHRQTVYTTWNFGKKNSRGLGITALFSGASGTGKTLAAEVLANELRLDLYRIDLSQVVSKYIGETEKNLSRVFDAAEEGAAILLFDEADALFGKRSEVKDSHDRYANIEISYLLQRMETYRGLAILTTNMKEALDQAFLRRIRFVVPFPFPNSAQRAEIWHRILPETLPAEVLDVNKLARLNVTGGSIYNIALNAAFLAAEDGQIINMPHLLRAARSEYAKLERTLTEGEIGGWI